MNKATFAPGYYPVGLPINSHVAKFGALDPGEYALRRQNSLEILEGSASLVRQFYQYLVGYSSSTSVSMAQYKDLLIALSIGKSVRSAQGKDLSYSSLTNHSFYWWKKFCFREAWPEDRPVGQGPLGSLAFYIRDPAARNPLEYINNALTLFWQEVGQPYTLPVVQRHAQLVQSLGLNLEVINQWENALISLHTRDNVPSTAAPILKDLRTELLGPSSWESLYLRFLLGEINPVVVAALQKLVDKCTAQPLVAEYFGLTNLTVSPQALFDRIQNLVPPGGMPQVYLALSIESWIKTVQLLLVAFEANPALPLESYSGFFLRPQYETLGRSLSVSLSLSYDAWSILGKFQTFAEAKGLAYRSYLECLNLYRRSDAPILAADPERITLPVSL